MKENHLMKNAILLFFLFGFSCLNLFAQSSCQNIDFELGNLDHWSSEGNIKMVNGGQTDTYGHFPLASSGFFAVKLGNIESSLPSTISRSIQIDNSTKYFIYSYAVVLLGMDHSESEAARIELKITDTAGNIIPCTNFVALARPLISDGYLQSDSMYMALPIFYKPWTTNAIDLTPYIGQTLNFEIVNKWCIYDVHFAYSYVDAYCTSQLINSYESCEDQKHYIRSIEGFNEYFWNGPGIVSGEGTNLIEVDQPGLYTVDIPNTDPSCDSVHLDVQVTMNELPDIPEVDFNWSSFCLGDTATLYGQTNTFSPIEEQLWIINETDTLENVSEQIILDQLQNYTITCIVTNESGCSASLTKTFSVRQLPLIEIGDQEKICPGEPLKLYNRYNSESTLTWNTGDVGSFIEVDTQGVYYAIAYDGYCENRDSMYVDISDAYLGIIPNIITPNNDQVNDEFIIESSNLKNYHLVVMNRWGNQMFETNNSTLFWDGKLNSDFVADGVYYYVLKYVCEEKELKKVGFLQVQK